MLQKLTNLTLVAAGICLLLYFFADVFMPSVTWFSRGCMAALKPTAAAAAVLLVLTFLTPPRMR